MKCDDKIVNRLKRTSGQMDGVLKMLDDSRSCEEILVQLSAIRSGIDRAMALISSANLIEALGTPANVSDEAVQKALKLLIKTR